MTSYSKAYICKNCGTATTGSGSYCDSCTADLVSEHQIVVARRIMQGESRGDVANDLERTGIDNTTVWKIIEAGDEALADDEFRLRLETGDYRKPAEQPPVNRGTNDIVWGVIWAGGGAIVSFITYSAASDGSSYFMFWGAIGYGIFRIIRGFIRLAD